MRNLCLLLTAVLLCSLAVPAQTREQVWHSGNEFLSICGVDADKTIDEETPAEIHATRDCIPYVRGLDDGITLLDTDYCASDGLTNGQLEKILLKFIKDNPAKAHFATVVLFMGAVEAAFPCPKK